MPQESSRMNTKYKNWLKKRLMKKINRTKKMVMMMKLIHHKLLFKDKKQTDNKLFLNKLM